MGERSVYERFNVSPIKVKIAEKYCKMFMGQRGRKIIHFCASETFILTQNSNCTFSHWTVHGDKSFTVYEEKHILRCHFTVFSFPPFPLSAVSPRLSRRGRRPEVPVVLTWHSEIKARGRQWSWLCCWNMWLYGRKFACQQCSMLMLRRTSVSLLRQQRPTRSNYIYSPESL